MSDEIKLKIPAKELADILADPARTKQLGELGWDVAELRKACDAALIPTERVHHPFSASKLQSLEACPCYEGKDSKHERTIAGTRAHSVTETGQDDHRLSDDDVSAAAECMDFYESRRRLMEEERIRRRDVFWSDKPEIEKDGWPEIIELKETYLTVDDEQFDDCVATSAGYVDRALIAHDQRTAELFDWKFGMWPVENAANNLQGIDYSLGLFRLYPTLESIRFWFKQPLLNIINEATFTRAQVPDLYLRVQTVVARAREARRLGDFSLAKPFTPVCNFCANLGKCPKVLDFALNIAKKFHPVGIPEHVTPSLVLDPRQTRLAMDLASIMKVWSEAFRARITDRVIRREAECPEGFVIQSRTGNREVVDRDKYKSAALTYLTEAEYNATLEVSLGAVEELIKDKAPRGLKTAHVEQFKKVLEESGATKKGTPYSFLQAKAVKE